MLDELKRGKNVQNRRLATWLTEEEYESFESDWESQQQIREELQDKPSELQRYEDKLKEAIMMRNRSDTYHRKGKKSEAYKLDSKCESLCEDVLELMLASSASVLALVMKIAKPDTKTVTRTISIPKTKVIKQPILRLLRNQLSYPLESIAFYKIIKHIIERHYSCFPS